MPGPSATSRGRPSWSWNGSTTTSPTSARCATTSATASCNAHALRVRERLLRLNARTHRATGCCGGRLPRRGRLRDLPDRRRAPRDRRRRRRDRRPGPGPQRRARPLHRHRHPDRGHRPSTSVSSATLPAPAASHPTPASTTPSPTPPPGPERPHPRPAVTSWPGSWSAPRRSRPRSPCSTICSTCSASARSPAPSPPGPAHSRLRGRASSKAGAAPSPTASNSTPAKRHLTRAQDRRPVVLQLARPARGPGRHDRPRLPPGQQELQPLLRRQRPVTAPRGHPAYSLEIVVSDDQFKRTGQIIADASGHVDVRGPAPRRRAGSAGPRRGERAPAGGPGSRLREALGHHLIYCEDRVLACSRWEDHTRASIPLDTPEDLAIAYTPGVGGSTDSSRNPPSASTSSPARPTGWPWSPTDPPSSDWAT